MNKEDNKYGPEEMSGKPPVCSQCNQRHWTNYPCEMNKHKNPVVKIYRDDEGIIKEHPRWHLIDPGNLTGAATLCTGEFFGVGESACEFEEKNGEVDCPMCIEIIKRYKAIKL